MTKKLNTQNGYKALVGKIQKELANFEALVKAKGLEANWKVGRYTTEYIFENKERADYGKRLIELLAKDTGKSSATLWRAVQFYQAYPILARVRELSWRHYCSLLTIKNDSVRKKLEYLAIKNDWNSDQLIEHVKQLKQKQAQQYNPKEIPILSFTRGRLNTYKVVASGAEQVSPLVIDLGFQMRRALPEAKKLGLKAGDIIKVDKSIKKIAIEPDQLYTYKAYVEKVIDGDTIWAFIDTDFGMLIRQKLRFRGIDCPELSTKEGQRAKRFVQNKLKNCDFIIINTHKDKFDKYDRYLADIFYPSQRLRLGDEEYPQKVLRGGVFLNQELLDKGLARIM